jgi:two-component system chemotaxis sensor kinase CheA
MSTPEQPADFAGRFMEDYFAECEEHLTAVRRGLLGLESAIGQPEPPAAIVEELFRSFHSLKGISAMVELHDAERLAHELESCLRAIRDRETVLSAEALDALVGGVDTLEQAIAARRSNRDAPSIAGSLDRLASVSRTVRRSSAPTSTPPAAADGQVWRVTFTPSADLVARGIKVDTIRGRLMQAGQIQSVAPRVTGGGIAFDFQVVAASGEAFAWWRPDGLEAEQI